MCNKNGYWATRGYVNSRTGQAVSSRMSPVTANNTAFSSFSLSLASLTSHAQDKGAKYAQQTFKLGVLHSFLGEIENFTI